MEQGAAASHAPGNLHEQKSPYPLPASCSLACNDACVTHWVGRGQCRQVCIHTQCPALDRRSLVVAEPQQHPHGDCDQKSQPASPRTPMQPASFRATFWPLLCIFCHLALARSHCALHWLGMSPRNSIFAQTGSRARRYWKGVPHRFLLLISAVQPVLQRYHQPPSLICPSVLFLLLMGHLH